MPEDRPSWSLWIVAISLTGLAVSAYLWSAKAGTGQLVCGAFGDCAGVNASAYSEVLGVPVAALGAVTYLALAILGWLSYRGPARAWITAAGFALALAGALFALYLTAVEVFVLRAYCVWCLLSWGLITAGAGVWGWHLWRASAPGPSSAQAVQR